MALKAILGAVVTCAGLTSAAGADVIQVHDQTGAQVAVDTATVAGCTIIFDANGTPFELCRLEKVEMRPPESTRSRPGHESSAEESSVVYTRVSE